MCFGIYEPVWLVQTWHSDWYCCIVHFYTSWCVTFRSGDVNRQKLSCQLSHCLSRFKLNFTCFWESLVWKSTSYSFYLVWSTLKGDLVVPHPPPLILEGENKQNKAFTLAHVWMFTDWIFGNFVWWQALQNYILIPGWMTFYSFPHDLLIC